MQARTCRNRFRLTGFLLAALLISACDREAAVQQAAPSVQPAPLQVERPNFLLIVADDMGYSDMGAFGGEIATPNLDTLAHQGMRLSGFYTAAACAPTRAMLLTGLDHHAVGVGTVEFTLPAQRDQPGYRLYLDQQVPTVAELLTARGYHTMMSGKWHLGQGAGQPPADRGFESSFALLEGGHNHYGVDQSHLGPPVHYRLNGVEASWPQGAYSSDYFAGQLLGFLEEDDARPFFAYLSFTAPHWPLQAPTDIVEKYEDRYLGGPRVLQEQRLARQRELGLLGPDVAAHPLEDVIEWDSLSEAERALEARKMAVHAAMVDRLDYNVGRVLDHLRASGRLDNTVVIFLSDNGAEGMFGDEAGRWGFAALAAAMSAAGGTPPVADNSFDNLGSASSISAIGKGWAQAVMAPFRRYKTLPTEGGIHAPAFFSGPGITLNATSGALVQVADVMPTVLELAGVEWPVEQKQAQRGRSLVPLLAGKVTRVYGDDDEIGWELFGGSALRRGDWKAVYVQSGDWTERVGYWGPGHWELFNVGTDPGETIDLAGQHPDVVASLVDAWIQYAKDNDVVLLFPDTQSARSPQIDSD